MGIVLAPSVSSISILFIKLKVLSVSWIFGLQLLFGPFTDINSTHFRSVQRQYMTKIKSLRGRFQKVHVQFVDKDDNKTKDYKNIPLEDPDRFLYNLSSMQLF